MTRSIHVTLEDLRLDKIYVVYPGTELYTLHARGSPSAGWSARPKACGQRKCGPQFGRKEIDYGLEMRRGKRVGLPKKLFTLVVSRQSRGASHGGKEKRQRINELLYGLSFWTSI
jgi:hypothetical protein